MKNDLSVKAIIDQLGSMIDARLKTNNVIMLGQMKAEIMASEARIRGDMATKDDIKNMATKDDIQRLEKKLDKKMEEDEKRFERIEDELNLSRTNKN